MRGRGAAAAAGNVQVAGLRHAAQRGGHLLRQLVVLAHRVRQARVRIADDGHVAEAGDGFHERNQFLGAQRAVEAERRQRIVADGGMKGFERLARQRAAGAVAGRHRHDGGKAVLHLRQRVERGLGVERVEAGLDQDKVHAAFDEGGNLFAINVRHFVERQGPGRGVGQVGAHGQRLGGGADAAGHPDIPRRGVRSAAGNRGTQARQFGRLAVHPVFPLRDAVRAESIGFDDIGTGFDVGAVYPGDQPGLREVQRIEVPAAAFALEHRAHRTVEQQDPFLHRFPDIIVCFHSAKIRIILSVFKCFHPLFKCGLSFWKAWNFQ